jgi:hypothetical protein
MYRAMGEIHRIPGHGKAEVYDEEAKQPILTDINQWGETNEYIHPICHYRNLVRGPEENSALKDFTRTFEEGNQGRGRFWWRKNGDSKKLPEWVILEHEQDGVNFERTWYTKAEKTEGTLKKLKAAGCTKDFLEILDEKADFSIGRKQGWEYP